MKTFKLTTDDVVTAVRQAIAREGNEPGDQVVLAVLDDIDLGMPESFVQAAKAYLHDRLEREVLLDTREWEQFGMNLDRVVPNYIL